MYLLTNGVGQSKLILSANKEVPLAHVVTSTRCSKPFYTMIG